MRVNGGDKRGPCYIRRIRRCTEIFQAPFSFTTTNIRWELPGPVPDAYQLSVTSATAASELTARIDFTSKDTAVFSVHTRGCPAMLLTVDSRSGEPLANRLDAKAVSCLF